MLRKIERAPAEAPLTSAAVRSLERSRKNKGAALLEYSRSRLTNSVQQLHGDEQKIDSVVDISEYRENEDTKDASTIEDEPPRERLFRFISSVVHREKEKPAKPDRKPITEVLHDIYDEKIQ